jgi:hypothetical protein
MKIACQNKNGFIKICLPEERFNPVFAAEVPGRTAYLEPKKRVKWIDLVLRNRDNFKFPGKTA